MFNVAGHIDCIHFVGHAGAKHLKEMALDRDIFELTVHGYGSVYCALITGYTIEKAHFKSSCSRNGKSNTP